jgi:hypothetical protein
MLPCQLLQKKIPLLRGEAGQSIPSALPREFVHHNPQQPTSFGPFCEEHSDIDSRNQIETKKWFSDQVTIHQLWRAAVYAP